MSTQRLRVIVSGLIAQHPSLGGVAWDYVQYAAGLHRLGHDVYYFEDSGEWPYTLDGGPSGNDWIAHDCSPNVTHLANVMERFGLKDRWAYRFPIKPRWFGMSHARRREILRTADLLINVSGSLERPEQYRSVRRLAYIDSDPVFTQIKLALPLGHLKFQGRVRAHDVHFSFGERLSTTVPTTYQWKATRQPILMSEWSPSGEPTAAYTTVMSWASYKPVRYRNERYGQKDVEFRRFISLPAQVPAATFDVALNATEHIAWQTDGDSAPPASAGAAPSPRRVTAAELLTSAGWNVIDARAECSDLHRYRRFIQRSRAEWSVAKNGYVKGRAGWFSCRSACYLAAGRPVIVQDTGFSDVIPTGIGVLAFNTLDEAAAAVKDVEANYRRHARAALEIAAAYFDSDRVLSDFVEQAMSSAPLPELQRVGA
jgi:hypothetical protein